MNIKEKCCGCTACVNICPVSAIHMERDAEGFLYPMIDERKCMHCDLCEKVCAFKKTSAIINHNFITEAYAVRSSDKNILVDSTSGGAFTMISNVILAQNGFVVGCTYSEDCYHVTYSIADSETLRNKMRGSKYIQAEASTMFQDVKALLEQEKIVLFTGTPCFAEGLLSYIPEKLRERLYTCAIVCHGSPSPLIWKTYLEEQESIEKSKITSFRFRDKNKQKSVAVTKEGKVIDIRTYLDLYYSNCIMRPCCYTCKYATPSRSVDLTIGDFWGIEKALPEWETTDASLVLVHSYKGKEIMDKCREQMLIHKCQLEDALQDNLRKPTERPPKRDRLWKAFDNKGIKSVLKKYTSNSFYFRWKKKVKSILH